MNQKSDVLKILKSGLVSGKISEAEYQLHQELARRLAEAVENSNEEEIAELHQRMKEILEKCM